jgi:dienelactone hydrolase
MTTIARPRERGFQMPNQADLRPRLLTAQQATAYLIQQEPPLRFRGQTRLDWEQWRAKFAEAIRTQLGPWPEKVPLRPEVVEVVQCEGYRREKIVFDSDAFSSVPAYVLIPDGLAPGERRRAILYAHGHGIGKAGAVGLPGPNGETDGGYQKAMAVQLVRQGYVVIAPDWRPFGERKDEPEWVRVPTRDNCNVAYMAYGYWGYHMLALNVNDARRCLDYLETRPEVNPDGFGMIGCSYGGTMTTYTSALEDRIVAANIVCYLSTLRDALQDRMGNFCGAQYMPGLRKYGDIADVAGLIAPRPLMIQAGERDTCFVIEDVMEAYAHLQRIYAAAGASANLELDRFDGEHEIHVETALDFFARRLPAR